jgi:hypothetical protein
VLGLNQAPRHREAHVTEPDKSNVHDVIFLSASLRGAEATKQSRVFLEDAGLLRFSRNGGVALSGLSLVEFGEDFTRDAETVDACGNVSQ